MSTYPDGVAAHADEVRAMHAQGLSEYDIAAALRVSHSTARRWRMQLGLESHPTRRDFSDARARELGYADVDAALVALSPEHTRKEIAALLNAPYQTVYLWQMQAGLVESAKKEAPCGPKQKRLQRLAAQGLAEPTGPITLPAPMSQERLDSIQPPAPVDDGRPLLIAAGERWCMRCGEVFFAGYCPRCNWHEGVDPRAILQPEEWAAA